MIWGYLWFASIPIAIIIGIVREYGVLDRIKGGILFGLVAIIIGACIMTGLNAICYSPSDDLELLETKEIYALKDNSYLSGGGFIYVKVEEEDKYTYMTINEDGSYSKESISKESATDEDIRIKEVDGETPVLKKYSRKSKNEFWSIWDEDCYYFVVPKGTVTHEFNVNLE